ncbi:MAG: acyl-CoA dehydrogenase family protein [Solirubrobacterales bacterium]
MRGGLRALRSLAQMELIDRVGLRELTEQLVYSGTRNGFVAANTAARSFKAVQKLTSPKRQPSAKPKALFDLTPSDEQEMMVEAFGDFAAQKLRPAASEADAACKAPDELMAQAGELGITSLGVPEELGGVTEERSAVTSVLISEALAKGDMGIAVAALSPAAVSTALGLWGDADQQATYLPPFVAEHPPAAALAITEPRALFDPFELETKARREGDGFVLDGFKSLVPRHSAAELFIVAAELDGPGPALFVVEPSSDRVLVEEEPGMGIRAARTGQLKLDGVKLGAGALLGEGSPDVYADCIRLARIGWCAVACGTAAAVLDYVTTYVNERSAFGEPISHRQAVAFTVADMAIETEGMRLATLRAAGLVDQGKDFARETAIARRLCANKGMKIGSDGVQMLGGHGYTKEHPVERWYRDLRAAGVMEGALLV